MRFDPLINSEAVSAALVYIYLIQHGRKVSMERVAKQFQCPERRVAFYAGRIASILDSVSSENVPVRFICNTPPEQFGESSLSAARDEQDTIGEKIFVSTIALSCADTFCEI